MKTVSVTTKNSKYEIDIGKGLLARIGGILKELGFSGKVVIITDTTVNELYGQVLEQSLFDSGFEPVIFTLPPGEKQKNLTNIGRLATHLNSSFADRRTPILATGGGVIGDLAGFVAATYMRGVPLIQIPTTLLAQVDAGIGGKVAVDHGSLKNVIGAFYQPRLVTADVSVLKTLTPALLSDGLAEVIKYGMIADRDFFDYLEANLRRITAFDEDILAYIVFKSAEIKARIVEQDEYDTGLRNVLNFGHTVGHAIESVSGFEIRHGEAVSLGMIAAVKISQKLGMSVKTDLSRLEKLLKQASLPVKMPDLKTGLLLKVITHDKKITGGKIRFILTQGIGSALISDDLDMNLIKMVLENRDEKT